MTEQTRIISQLFTGSRQALLPAVDDAGERTACNTIHDLLKCYLLMQLCGRVCIFIT